MPSLSNEDRARAIQILEQARAAIDAAADDDPERPGGDAQPPAGADHPRGDLAPVGDQHPPEPMPSAHDPAPQPGEYTRWGYLKR